MKSLHLSVITLIVAVFACILTACGGKEDYTDYSDVIYPDTLKHPYIYFSGITEDSVKHYLQEAGKGNTDAMFMLAHCYERGLYCDLDSAKAISWLRKAAVAGNYDAQMRICEIYNRMFNSFAKYDYQNEENVSQTKKLAEQGQAWAQCIIGDLFNSYRRDLRNPEEIKGFNPDDKQALEWYQKSAAQGFAYGQLGQLVVYTKYEYRSNDYNKHIASRCGLTAIAQGAKTYYNVYGQEIYNDIQYDKLYPMRDSLPDVPVRLLDERKEVIPDSIHVYQKLASEGDPVGEMLLAMCYMNGIGIQQNVERGLELVESSALKGYYLANSWLGEIYRNGLYGKEKWEYGAEKYHRVAASQGYVWSMIILGQLSFRTNYKGEKDYNYARANYFFTKAFALDSTDKEKLREIGLTYYNNDDATSAFFYLEKALEHGSDDNGVMYALAQCYYHGWGTRRMPNETNLRTVDRKDYDKALHLFRVLSEKGDARSNAYIGLIYENGQGVDPNMTTALSWYRKAEQMKNGLANYRLGLCYEYGRGVEIDLGKAAEYYKAAADQGEVDAMMRIAQCFQNGIGVARNEADALDYYRKASDRGNVYAQQILDSINPTKDIELERKLDKGATALFEEGVESICIAPRNLHDAKLFFGAWLKKVNFFVLLGLAVLILWLLGELLAKCYRFFKPVEKENDYVGKTYRVLYQNGNRESWFFSDNHHLLVTDNDDVVKEHDYAVERNGLIRVSDLAGQGIVMLKVKPLDLSEVEGQDLNGLMQIEIGSKADAMYGFQEEEKVLSLTYEQIDEQNAFEKHVTAVTEKLRKCHWWWLKESVIGVIIVVLGYIGLFGVVIGLKESSFWVGLVGLFSWFMLSLIIYSFTKLDKRIRSRLSSNKQKKES